MFDRVPGSKCTSNFQVNLWKTASKIIEKLAALLFYKLYGETPTKVLYV